MKFFKFFTLICAVLFILTLFCSLAACNNFDKKTIEQEKIDSNVNNSSSIAEKSTTSEYETDSKNEDKLSWFERLMDGVSNITGLNDEQIADRTFDEFVNAIKNQDKAKLELLFSKNAVKKAETLDKDIEKLFSFIKGNIISFSRTENTGIPAETTYDYGKEKRLISPCFTLETDKEKYYLGIKQCTTDEFDRNNEGITYICIINAEDWNEDYFYMPYYENTFGIIID